MAEKLPNITVADGHNLLYAIEMAIASAKRGSNTSKKPEFKAIYDKQIKEYTELQLKIAAYTL